MHLLNEVTKDFLTRGVDTLRKETADKAALIYAFLDNNAAKNPAGLLTPSISNKDWRSETVIVATTPVELGGSAPIMSRCMDAGFTIASGYHTDKDIKVRIANFPQHTKNDTLLLLGVLKNN
jgi:phosphoserine aminotransferase